MDIWVIVYIGFLRSELEEISGVGDPSGRPMHGVRLQIPCGVLGKGMRHGREVGAVPGMRSAMRLGYGI